jgi:hypothetical protein
MIQRLPLPETLPPRRLARLNSPGLRVVFRLLLLAAPFALFLVGFGARFARLNPSHLAAKRHLLEQQAPRIEVLILGSSHELTGVFPTDLGVPAFNLAGQSQSVYYDAALVRKYLPALKSLKLVVLPISYFSLEYELDEAGENWRAYDYFYFYSIPHRDWHKAFSARNFSTYFLCSESFRARVLFGTATNAALDYDAWGGWTNRPCGPLLPAKAHTDFLRQAARLTLERHEAMMRPENFEPNLARLDGLIGELQRKHIGVLLVTLPVTRFYGQNIRPATYRRMQQAVHRLAGNYNLEYLNCMFDSRFHDQDFADGDHLNCRGAHKFSGILAREIAAILRE